MKEMQDVEMPDIDMNTPAIMLGDKVQVVVATADGRMVFTGIIELFSPSVYVRATEVYEKYGVVEDTIEHEEGKLYAINRNKIIAWCLVDEDRDIERIKEYMKKARETAITLRQAALFVEGAVVPIQKQNGSMYS